METSKTLAHGTLGANSDTWFLMTRDQMLLVDVSFVVDSSLEGKTVSIVGTMGTPPGSPFVKLIAERIVGHEAIAARAFEIYHSDPASSADDNWLRAERELLEL